MAAQDEVASLCSDLIRIDTTNRGDHSGPGERAAGEHVAALLAEVGLAPEILESHPGRASGPSLASTCGTASGVNSRPSASLAASMNACAEGVSRVGHS